MPDMSTRVEKDSFIAELSQELDNGVLDFQVTAFTMWKIG